jgi:hypothetical protein
MSKYGKPACVVSGTGVPNFLSERLPIISIEKRILEFIDLDFLERLGAGSKPPDFVVHRKEKIARKNFPAVKL